MFVKSFLKKTKKSHRSRLGILPYILTLSNACLGFLAVICAINHHFTIASWFIGCAAVCDACDGRLARALGMVSFLGAELDTLADAITFCCAPALLIYLFYHDVVGFVMIAALLIFLCAGLFRLARFNVGKSGDSNFFVGLPTPIAALTLSALIMQVDSLNGICSVPVLDQRLVAVLLVALAILMVSAIPFATCKSKFFSGALLLLCAIMSGGVILVWLSGCHGLLSLPLGYILAYCIRWLMYGGITYVRKHWLVAKAK